MSKGQWESSKYEKRTVKTSTRITKTAQQIFAEQKGNTDIYSYADAIEWFAREVIKDKRKQRELELKKLIKEKRELEYRLKYVNEEIEDIAKILNIDPDSKDLFNDELKTAINNVIEDYINYIKPDYRKKDSKPLNISIEDYMMFKEKNIKKHAEYCGYGGERVSEFEKEVIKEYNRINS